MPKIDSQFITLYKVEDNANVRSYSVVTGDSTGLATYDKNTKNYKYNGDQLGEFADFVEMTLTNSVLKNKVLPDKVIHGFG